MNIRHLRGHRLAAVLLAALLLTAACSRGGDDPDQGSTEPDTSPSLPVLTGDFLYNAGEVEASFTYHEDGTGVLRVVNGTDDGLGAPSVYLLDARDGSRIDVTDPGSKALAAGERERVEVTLDRTVEAKHIGIVALLMGEDDFGAFLQQQGQEPAS
jgi:hypothetical protein